MARATAPNGRTDRLAAGAAVLSVALWASTFAVFKVVFRRIDPLAATGIRYALLLALVAAYLWRTRSGRTLRGRDLRLVLVAGVLGYFCLEFFFVLGLARTSAIASAILIATHPIWGMTFSALGSRRRPAARELAGFAVGMLGVVVFLGSAGFGEVRAGDVLSLLAAIAFGAYAAIVERVGGRVPRGELVGTSLAAGAVLLVLVSLPATVAQDWSVALPSDLVLILYAALGPVLLGFALWAFALQHRGMARTAPFGYLEPVFAAALAIAVLGERFTSRQVIGGALVLAGVVLAAGRNVEPAEPPPL